MNYGRERTGSERESMTNCGFPAVDGASDNPRCDVFAGDRSAKGGHRHPDLWEFSGIPSHCHVAISLWDEVKALADKEGKPPWFASVL